MRQQEGAGIATLARLMDVVKLGSSDRDLEVVEAIKSFLLPSPIVGPLPVTT
jgi:hypothetical protein